jgi:glycosyltransferase involved in cell wall biosynthesis
LTDAPGITVAVPTRDRPAALARCLEAIGAQTARERLEVVVCDDGSRDARAVAATVAGFPGARIVRIEGRGPAAARNAAVDAALAPIVCFTDDDCIPDPEWAALLAAALAPGGAAAAAGRTLNARPADALAVAAQVIADSLIASAPGDPGAVTFAPTSNLAGRTDLLRDLPFDEGYPSAGGEDRDWCLRLGASGERLLYEPRAVVHHHQQLTLAGFLGQQIRYGRGAYRFHRAHPAAGRGDLTTLVRRGFALGAAPGMLVCAAQAATAVGMADEALARAGITRPRVTRARAPARRS